MTIESIFAYIFYNRKDDFVIKLEYMEINNEQVYDLLDNGETVSNLDELTTKRCSSIDEFMEFKTTGDKCKLSSILSNQDEEQANLAQSSTLMVRITVESID